MWIFAAAMALMLQAGEWVGLPPVEGFVVGYQQTAGPQSIEERVPRGETVQDWSRMITTLKLTWAEGVLDAVALCSAASAHPQCRR